VFAQVAPATPPNRHAPIRWSIISTMMVFLPFDAEGVHGIQQVDSMRSASLPYEARIWFEIGLHLERARAVFQRLRSLP